MKIVTPSFYNDFKWNRNEPIWQPSPPPLIYSYSQSFSNSRIFIYIFKYFIKNNENHNGFHNIQNLMKSSLFDYFAYR